MDLGEEEPFLEALWVEGPFQRLVEEGPLLHLVAEGPFQCLVEEEPLLHLVVVVLRQLVERPEAGPCSEIVPAGWAWPPTDRLKAIESGS